MEEILHRKYPIIYMGFLHPNGGWPWDFTSPINQKFGPKCVREKGKKTNPVDKRQTDRSA